MFKPAHVDLQMLRNVLVGICLLVNLLTQVLVLLTKGAVRNMMNLIASEQYPAFQFFFIL